MKKIEIFTDGACSGNPGPGGWAAILKYKNNIKKISGFVPNTTNNRMEIFALINSLNILKENCEIIIYSDSKYIIDSITKGWVFNWKKKFVWVKGHDGHAENEECDKMAVAEIKNHKNKF